MRGLRLVSINDVYDLKNLPKLATFIRSLNPAPAAVVMAGDFLSPSTLSSIDGGRGMVAVMRACGVSHAILGNHEADFKLNVLRDRIMELSKSVVTVNSNMRHVSHDDPSSSWLSSETVPDHAVVNCGSLNLALVGLMSDEPNMFRGGTFRGVKIGNVLDTYRSLADSLDVDLVVPVTHQSVERDRELAAIMAEGVIIGGHEHHRIHDRIGDVHIVKTGSDAEACSVIDLSFEEENRSSSCATRLTSTSVEFVDLKAFDDCPAVSAIASKHLRVISALESELIVDASMVPPTVLLSSKATRYQQTTMGAFFCSSIRDELEMDACIINGASIKGGADYPDNSMSFAQLKKELPFPTKIVTVEMTRRELVDSVVYSRTQPEAEEEEELERRGYLQVDFDFDVDQDLSNCGNEVLKVALPRNLMSGFCNIKPLMEVGDRLKSAGQFPSDDDFIPALDLVTRHCCKEKWSGIISRHITFEDIDMNNDGVLDKGEVRKMMAQVLGHEPENFVVDAMMEAIDENGDGVIQAHEFDHLLAMTISKGENTR